MDLNKLEDGVSKNTSITPRYFVQITESNYKILNQYLHKHWKDYLGYKDNWEVSAIGFYFCSESNLNIEYCHIIGKYPDLPTDSLLTTYEFLLLLDIDLLNRFKSGDKSINKSVVTADQSFPIQPDFSAQDLIILKHLLDSNIKFDSNDFNFYKSLFQLGYDYSISTRTY